MYQKIHHYPKKVLKNSQKSKFKFKITDFKHFFRVVVHLLVHSCKFVTASRAHAIAHIETFSLFFQYIGFLKRGGGKGGGSQLGSQPRWFHSRFFNFSWLESHFDLSRRPPFCLCFLKLRFSHIMVPGASQERKIKSIALLVRILWPDASHYTKWPFLVIWIRFLNPKSSEITPNNMFFAYVRKIYDKKVRNGRVDTLFSSG